MAATENGSAALSRTAEIVTAEFNHDYLYSREFDPSTKIISVKPDRAVVRSDQPAQIVFEFDRSLLVPLGDVVARMRDGGKIKIGRIIVRLHFMIANQARTADVEIPVYLNA